MRYAYVVVACGVIGAISPGLASAQRASAAKVLAGGHFGLSPVGTLDAGTGGLSASSDAATSFEIGGVLELRVTPLVSIGFAPTVLLDVKTTRDTQSGSLLDLPARLAVGSNVAPKTRLYGFVAPGYSILFPPSNDSGTDTHPSGFMVGFGGGAEFRIAPRFMLTGELGYQLRFLSASVAGIDVSIHANYLTFAVGAVVAID